jgi:hypothetical protein
MGVDCALRVQKTPADLKYSELISYLLVYMYYFFLYTVEIPHSHDTVVWWYVNTNAA